MIFEFKSLKHGHRVQIDAQASVLATGKNVSNYTFPKGRLEDIHIPTNTSGSILIKLTITLYLQHPTQPEMPFKKDVTVKWNYSRLNGHLIISSSSIYPESNLSLTLGLTSWEVKSSHDVLKESFSAMLSVNWDNDGSKEITFELTNLPNVKLTIGTIWMERHISFGPFKTNSSEKLEKGSLVSIVHDWYRSMHLDTQKLIEKATRVDELPNGTKLKFEGYTSTLGAFSLNHQLGANRAKSVADIVKQTSGNNSLELFSTPTQPEEGERGARATDNKKEENNNPEWRVVKVTFWDKFDVRSP